MGSQAPGSAPVSHPGGDKYPWWLARVSVNLVCRKFLSSREGCFILSFGGGGVDKGGKGLEGGTSLV